MSKYGNIKSQAMDGTVCDSKKEARRLNQLLLLEMAGVIKALERQVKFVLIPAQKKDGKVVERECSYKADFVYWEEFKPGMWQKVVEDAKGHRTEVYRIKKKLMLYVHGVEIRET